MSHESGCPLCGERLHTDAVALRRAFVVCSHCNGIHRVELDGHPEVFGRLPRTLLPDGIDVIREATGCLAVRARRPAGSWAVNHLTWIVSWTAALAAGYGFAWQIGWLGLPIGALAFVATFVATAKLQPRSAPLRVAEGWVQPSVADSSWLACVEVTQVYAELTRAGMSPAGSITSCTIYALTQDGRRVALMGPVEREAAALYVAEVLEAELALVNRVVFGDVDDPEGYAAALLRLQPSEPVSSAFRYRIEEEADGLWIRPLDGEGWGRSLEVSRGRLILRCEAEAPEALACGSLGEIRVAEGECSDDRVSLDDALRGLHGVAAISGNVDLRQIIDGGTGADSFQVVVGVAGRGEILLLDGIRNLREADVICETLQRFVEKVAPPS